MTRLSRPTRLAASALLFGALIGGCASQGSGSSASADSAPKSTAATVYVENQCSFTTANTLVPKGSGPPFLMGPERAGSGHGGAIPDGFAPVGVIGCGLDVQSTPEDGTSQIATQRRADGDLDDLISAYRMPAPPDHGNGCTAEMDADPVIAFVDAKGTAIWPAPPRDARCGHISTRVSAALKALHWTVTKSERVGHASAQGS